MPAKNMAPMRSTSSMPSTSRISADAQMLPARQGRRDEAVGVLLGPARHPSQQSPEVCQAHHLSL